MKRSRQLWLGEGDLRGHRWDPGYWDPALRDPLVRCALPVTTLGEFIPADGIAYGRILPGKRPPEGDGPLYITQRSIRPTGVDPAACIRIQEDCPWDQPRLRVKRGDLLVPRSGVATLARGVMTVYLSAAPAVVDCFTDRVTLQGYLPQAATLFLRSTPGWLQIHRLINGVGPPNIAYDEIRGLRVPVFGDRAQEELRERYAEVRLVALFLRLGEVAKAGVSRRVLDGERAHLLNHGSREPFTGTERDLSQRGTVESSRRGQPQRGAVRIEEVDRADLRTHLVGDHLDRAVEDLADGVRPLNRQR